MISLTIDDVKISVPEGTTVLDAAQRAEIYIPHICSHPDLPPVEQLKPAEAVYRGGVRLENKKPNLQFDGCQLCAVQIEGKEGYQRACCTQVAEGMVVHTDADEVKEFRQERIMFLLAKHPHGCLTCAQKEGCARIPCSMNMPEKEKCCPRFGSCEFQKVIEHVGIKKETTRYVFKDLPVIKDEPLFERDYNLCIGCTRCIRACRDVRGVKAVDFVFDEEERVAIGTVSPTLRDSACRFCTACVEVCPTGALVDKKPFKEVPCQFTCPAGIDVPRYVRLIAEGKFDESYAVVRERLPLPSVCGYICIAFCEGECRRGEVNEPVGIRNLKRFVSENHTDLWKRNLKTPTATGKKVAILGSGPAGLTAGYYLARKGHRVTIFEQASLPGGMLRHAISRKRLPKKALQRDIAEIVQSGVELKLNSPKMRIEELFQDKFDAVLLAIGSTFVGAPASWLKEEGIELNSWGSVKVEPSTLATSRKGVFAAGDAILGGVSEDFVRGVDNNKDNFFKVLVDRLALYRGDSSRSAIQAVNSGRKVAQAVDRYLGGDGNTDEPFRVNLQGELLLAAEQPNHYLGREEGFADLKRISDPYRSRSPQYAGLSQAEVALTESTALTEAKRCLRCDLRLLFSKPVLPPKKELRAEFNAEKVNEVPEVEGVYQLLDEQKEVISIKGAINLRKALVEQLELGGKGSYFLYQVEPMYTKRESELLQQFVAVHGQMPEVNRELEDLF